MRVRHRPIGAVTLASVVASLSATAAAADLPRVPLEARSGTLGGRLPHKSDFMLDVIAPGDFDRATVTYWETDAKRCGVAPSDKETAIGSAVDPAKNGDRTIPVRIPALNFASAYCFSVSLERKWSTADATALKAALLEIMRSTPSTPAELAAGLRRRIPTVANLQTEPAHTTVAELLANAVFATKGWQDAHNNCVAEFPEQIAAAKAKAARFRDQVGESKAPVPAATAFATALSDVKWPKQPSDATADADLKAVRAAVRSFRDDTCASAPAATPLADVCARSSPTREALRMAVDHAIEARDACTKYTDDLLAADIDALVTGSIQSLETAGRSSNAVTTALPGYTDRAPFYLSGDFGGVVPIFPNSGADFALYAGISFTFAAVDKDVPLKGWALLQRLSLTAGFTLTDIKDPPGSARGVLDGKGVLLGAGFRVTDYVRIAGGAMLIRQRDGAGESVRANPYIAASVDVDVIGTIRGMIAKATP